MLWSTLFLGTTIHTLHQLSGTLDIGHQTHIKVHRRTTNAIACRHFITTSRTFTHVNHHVNQPFLNDMQGSSFLVVIFVTRFLHNNKIQIQVILVILGSTGSTVKLETKTVENLDRAFKLLSKDITGNGEKDGAIAIRELESSG